MISLTRRSVPLRVVQGWASALAEYLDTPTLILLYGTLGAGKSTFARSLLRAATNEVDIPSPTFAIVQEYWHVRAHLPIIHADLYRLTQAAEVEQIGLEEQLTQAIGLIEWPERAPQLENQHHWQIHFDFAKQDDERHLTWIVPEDHCLPPALQIDWQRL